MRNIRGIDLVINLIGLLVVGFLVWHSQVAYLLVALFFFIVEGYRIKSVEFAVLQAIIFSMVAATCEATRGVNMGGGYFLLMFGIVGFSATFTSWVFIIIAELKSRKLQETKIKPNWTRLLRAPVIVTFLVVAFMGFRTRLYTKPPSSYQELLNVHLMAERLLNILVALIIVASVIWVRAFVRFVLISQAKAREKQDTRGDQSDILH